MRGEQTMCNSERRWRLACLCLLIAPVMVAGGYVEEFPDHFTNDFVVQIDGDDDVADLVARAHGFKKIERVFVLATAPLSGSLLLTSCSRTTTCRLC